MIDLIAYDEEYLGVDIGLVDWCKPCLIVSRRQDDSEDSNVSRMIIDIYVKDVNGWNEYTTYEQEGSYDDLYDSWAVALQLAREDPAAEVWKVRNPL